MKTCPKCGAQLPDNAQVCFRCKASLSAQTVPPVQQGQPAAPQRPAAQQPQQNAYAAPQRPAAQQPAQNAYAAPPRPAAQQPQQNAYAKPQQPVQNAYAAPPRANVQPPEPGRELLREPPEAAPAKKKSRTGLIIGIIAGAVALLVIVGVVLVFVLKPKDNNNTEDPGTSQSQQADQPEVITYNDLPDYSITKIGEIKKDYLYRYDAGIYYKENDKYGILSLDGKKDTGAIYTNCTGEGDYFVVTKVDKETDEKDLSTINKYGMTDSEGNEVIAQKYAVIKQVYNSDRFYEVLEATEVTEDEDECLIFLEDGYYAAAPTEESTLFKGVWHIFDTQQKKVLENISGTHPTDITAYGNFISYTDDNGEDVECDVNGKSIPEEWEVFSTGYYCVPDDNTGTIYDPDGKQLFTYNESTDYVPYQMENGYFIAKKYSGDNYSYVCMGTDGKVLSKAFDDYICVSGNLIVCDGSIYDFKGNEVLKGDYTSIYQDDVFTCVYYAYADNGSAMIKEDGTVLYQRSDEVEVDSSNILSYIDADEGNNFYSLKDKDFTIKNAGAFEKFLVKQTGEDNNEAIIEVVNGKTLIKDFYTAFPIRTANNEIYVYVLQSGTAGAYELYSIK